MSSAITSGASAQSLLIAEGAQIGQGGILLKGSINCANGASITTNGDAVFGAPVGVGSSLFISETPLPALGSQQAWRWVVPAAGGEEGRLGLVGWDYTVSPPTQKEVLRVSAAPRVGGAANECILAFTAPLQSDTETIPLLATSVAVVNTAITASSVVMISEVGALNATATRFTVVLNPGVGFSITTNAAPTVNAKDVSYFIVKY